MVLVCVCGRSDKDSFEIYVDNYAVEAHASFADVGSAYLFELPSGERGEIRVRPTKRTDRPIVELFVDGDAVDAPTKK